jgi:hypothetical protein
MKDTTFRLERPRTLAPGWLEILMDWILTPDHLAEEFGRSLELAMKAAARSAHEDDVS